MQDEAAEVADLLAEEGVNLVPEEERYKLTDLDSLTGAGPMPWTSLFSCI